MQDASSQHSTNIPAAQRHLEEQMPSFLPTEKARLIVLEGIDLSGRTTQVQLLYEWLTAQNYSVTTTAWRTSPLVADVLSWDRDKRPLQPLTYSMLYCADYLDRSESVIKPALARGDIVLADRYIYTAFARDEARGFSQQWVRNLYRFAVKPDIVFYLHISPEEAVRRRSLLLDQAQIAYMDGKQKKDHKHARKERVKKPEIMPLIAPSFVQESSESFRDFETKMYIQYQKMQKEFDFSVIEGNQPVEYVQALLRRAIVRLL